MAIRSDRTIYQLLEKHLRKAKEPLTVTVLMDIDEIRSEALAEYGIDVRNATNKTSDALGQMWRKGLLTRYPAPKTELSFARFAYAWASDAIDSNVQPISPPLRLVGVPPLSSDMVVLIEALKRLTEAVQDVAAAIREK